jgi:hypothetical protein
VTKLKTVGIELPADTALELAVTQVSGSRDLLRSQIAALRLGGWTFESIATPLGMSRERVRQLYAESGDPRRAAVDATDSGFMVPNRPSFPTKEPYVRPQTSAGGLARLLELQPLVQQVRANSPRGRAEAEEFAALLWREHDYRGVSVYRLAKDLGVTHAAVRSRLIRYGYMTTTAKSKAYTAIREGNRV